MAAYSDVVCSDCGSTFRGRSDVCGKCRKKLKYRPGYVRKRELAKKIVKRKEDHKGFDVVNKNQTDGMVTIDGLDYKIGVYGRAFYYADKMWKLSSRPSKWVADQIKKMNGGSDNANA